jgi:ABC-type nitrate/sulfonate/bicarbonate transport system permease component
VSIPVPVSRAAVAGRRSREGVMAAPRTAEAAAAPDGRGRGLAVPRLHPRLWALALQLLGVGVGLVLWKAVSLTMDDAVMPGPIATARYIADNLTHSEYLVAHGLSEGNGYLPHLWYTTKNVLLGVGIGTAIGVAIGLASLRLRMLHEVASSITAVFGTAPIFVAAPFFLIWFGIVPTAQIMIVAFYTSLLLYVYSRRAGENIAAGYVESALTLGGKRWLIFRRVHLPGSIPEVTGGFRIALAGAWGLAGIAELLGSQQGAGFLIKFYSTAFVVDGMLAVIVLLGLIALLVDRLVVESTRYLTRWSEAGRGVR